MGAMELGSMINGEAIECELGIQVLRPTRFNHDQGAAHTPRVTARRLSGNVPEPRVYWAWHMRA